MIEGDGSGAVLLVTVFIKVCYSLLLLVTNNLCVLLMLCYLISFFRYFWWIIRPVSPGQRDEDLTNARLEETLLVQVHLALFYGTQTMWRQRKNNKLGLKELGFGERQEKR